VGGVGGGGGVGGVGRGGGGGGEKKPQEVLALYHFLNNLQEIIEAFL
jgi:hypothetical protein